MRRTSMQIVTPFEILLALIVCMLATYVWHLNDGLEVMPLDDGSLADSWPGAAHTRALLNNDQFRRESMEEIGK
jgi:hypothetical protein